MLTRSEQQASESEYFKVYPIGKVEKKDGRTLIVLDKKYEAGLKGLEKHSYVHVVYWFDRNDTPENRAILQVHPRGDNNNPLTGVFATHSSYCHHQVRHHFDRRECDKNKGHRCLRWFSCTGSEGRFL
jgi:hypothetical protein